jgi:6-phosphogluconolactonase
MRFDERMRLLRRSSAFLLASWFALPVFGAPKPAKNYFVYVGTYTRQQSTGIYAYRFNAGTGELASIGLVAETPNPTFLAIHPSGKFLYAANEIGNFQGQKGIGSITAYAIDGATGKLTQLNAMPSRGNGPCHLSVDKTGKCVVLANYGSGSFAAMPVKDDGSLGEATAFIQDTGSGPNPRRQREPHSHSFNISPDNRFAMGADLGVDKVFVFRLDPAKGTLTPNEPPFTSVNPGAGPRHFAFHPSGKFAFVINELQSTMTAFSYDAAKGVLKEVQTISTLPKDFTGTSYCAEVQVHPSGKFVYGSNRGHDSLAMFSFDAKKGALTPMGHVSTQGKTPRNFTIDPTGAWVFAANQDTNNFIILKIDAKTGKLTPTGKNFDLGMPVCVKFVAAR